jgi:hypothetical protein
MRTMRAEGWMAVILTAAVAGVLCTAPAQAQSGTRGQLHVSWGDGPDGAHGLYLIDESGNRMDVSLPAHVIDGEGGLAALDRKHVSLQGEFLSRTFDDGTAATAFIAQSLEFLAVPKLADGLVERAGQEGPIRVIVWLNTSFQPTGTLASAADVAAQEAGIATATSNVLQDLAFTSFEVVHTFESVPLLAIVASADALQALAASPHVTRVEIDELARPLLAQSAPLIGANTAWSAGFTGDSHWTAVLDTGVMKTHSFFGGRVQSEACYSSNGSTSNGTYQSLCPGGVTTSTAVNSGVNCTGIGGCDHGTHVAGIQAGSPFTGVTFAGVGRAARIIAIQVFTRFNAAADCSPSAAPCVLSFGSDQIKGLERVYALRNSIKIASANMSLGGGLTSANCDGDSRKPVIDLLRSVGIATVIAAGNNGSRTQISFPACISTAVSVGSTTKSDVVSSFSNAATIMHMWAPGSSINSSVITSTTAMGVKSGTSMAAPHVAGAWAVLKQKRPYAVGDEIRNAITSTGLSVTDTRVSPAGTVTKPRIRVANALNAINHSVQVTELFPTATSGKTLVLWARVRNNGTSALPGSAAVWFWVDGFGYVGSTSVGGLAAGANNWFSITWTLPATASGSIGYWARVWDGAQGGFWAGPWTGPQAVQTGFPAPITSLWPVPTRQRGQVAPLWARVANNRSAALPANSGVYRFVNRSGPFAGVWVGNNSLAGQAINTNNWYLLNWTIPAAHTTGIHNYWAQSWYLSGTWRQWSLWAGPEAFTIVP